MLNVLSIVSYQFLPPKMGGQKGIAFFNRFLSSWVNLTCLTTRNNRPEAERTYEVLNLLSNSKLRYINLFYFFTARNIIRQKKITHLIIEHPYYGWLGMMLKRFCKVKLVVHSHNMEAERFKTMHKWWWRILWWYEKRTHRAADHSFFIHDEDRAYAIRHFGLDPLRCSTITYGFELAAAPTTAERSAARDQLIAAHGISNGDRILLFNGTLDYRPNLEALEIILKKINPLLLSNADLKYKIIICGNRLPHSYKGLSAYRQLNVIYAGYVDDISLYFKGCDIFINPVNDGGGIKTKLVEALGYDMSVISTQSGATGVPVGITGDKLLIIEDSDWETLVKQVISMNLEMKVPAIFFDYFYWGNIADRAATALNKIES